MTRAERYRASVAASAKDLTAVVDLCLDADADRAYRLPGAGSRSLVYVFDGREIGALAVTADGRDLVPGSEHEGARLTFWVDKARILVSEGSSFAVWYGKVVGHGLVQSVGWKPGA
jgi:hypothetical protein